MKYRLGKQEYDSLTLATQHAVALKQVTGKTWIIECLFDGRWMTLADAVAIQARRYPHVAALVAGRA